MFFKGNLFIIIPIILAAFTHLWNPISFPYPEFDEGIYMGRALHFLKFQDFKDYRFSFDHPYFGSVFLAGIFKFANFVEPNLLNNSESYYENGTIELFLAARLAMGLLAIIDTILIYKIVERVYNNKTYGFFASILFAVMPVTWLSRWIHLDSIQLPFLLASIMFALIAKNNKLVNQNLWLVSLSGIFLGIAIFTKIPAFTMIPLIGYIIYRENKSVRNLAIWFIPVLVIPSIWPLYSIHLGEFSEWINGISEQTNRGGSPLHLAMQDIIRIDPVLLILGIIGSIYTIIKRDTFLILFTYPYLVFLFFINFVSSFHLLIIVISFCIAISRFILEILNFNSRTVALRWPAILILAVFGLTSSFILVTNGDNYSYFEALRYVHDYVRQSESRTATIVASPFYVFLPIYTSELRNYSFWTDDQFRNPELLQILDPEFKNAIKDQEGTASNSYHKIYNEFSVRNLRNFTNFENNSVDVIMLLPVYEESANVGKNIINLTDNQTWVVGKNVKILSSTDNITMNIDSSELARTGNTITLNTFINTTDKPPLLTLNYSLKTHSGNASLYPEIRIRDENNMLLWKKSLKYTPGNFVYYSFVLPDTLRLKPIKLIFDVGTLGVGKQEFTLKSGLIF